jgi:hypothetical protein
VTKSGKLNVYYTSVTIEVIVMYSCTGIVSESGKLVVYFTGVTYGVVVMDSYTVSFTESGKLICIALVWGWSYGGGHLYRDCNRKW